MQFLQQILPEYIYEKACMINSQSKINEIRIRVNRQVIFRTSSFETVLDRYVNSRDIDCIMERIVKHSLYAYEDEIKLNYITIEGGHRIGFTGKAVVLDGYVKTIKHINYINIRIARQIIGCAATLFEYLNKLERNESVLIIAAPACGKTTVLRDLIRLISDNNTKTNNISLIDERSEIAASYLGIPQNDVGKRTDVYDACPKIYGMINVLRTMSPDYIAIDEIGGSDDVRALEYVSNCGVSILATIHAISKEDLLKKEHFQAIIKNRLFDKYVFLENRNNPGYVKNIYNRDFVMDMLWEEYAENNRVYNDC